MNFWTVVGMIAACCTTGCWIPQAIKSVRSRHAEDFSWTYLCLLTFGVVLWAAYGYVRHDPAVFGANVVTFLFLLPVLYVKARSGQH